MDKSKLKTHLRRNFKPIVYDLVKEPSIPVRDDKVIPKASSVYDRIGEKLTPDDVRMLLNSRQPGPRIKLQERISLRNRSLSPYRRSSSRSPSRSRSPRRRRHLSSRVSPPVTSEEMLGTGGSWEQNNFPVLTSQRIQRSYSPSYRLANIKNFQVDPPGLQLANPVRVPPGNYIPPQPPFLGTNGHQIIPRKPILKNIPRMNVAEQHLPSIPVLLNQSWPPPRKSLEEFQNFVQFTRPPGIVPENRFPSFTQPQAASPYAFPSWTHGGIPNQAPLNVPVNTGVRFDVPIQPQTNLQGVSTKVYQPSDQNSGSSLVGNSPRKIVGIDLTAVKFMAPDDEMLRYIQTKSLEFAKELDSRYPSFRQNIGKFVQNQFTFGEKKVLPCGQYNKGDNCTFSSKEASTPFHVGPHGMSIHACTICYFCLGGLFNFHPQFKCPILKDMQES